MNYKELQQALADSDRKFAEMEALVQQRIDIEMKSPRPDRMAVLRLKEQASRIRNRAISKHDSIKKEYAMQSSQADVGDVIMAEVKFGRQKDRRTVTMRVDRIEVAAFEEPTLIYYGTYLRADGTPCVHQRDTPIYQYEIFRVKHVTCR